MILSGILFATVIVTFLGFYRWRLGLLASFPFGFMADAARKVVEEQPVYLSALVVLPVVASLLGARRVGRRFIPVRLLGQGAWVKVPLILYIMLVLLQSLNGVYTSRSPVVGIIGLISYLAPILGAILGVHYARSTSVLRRFLRWYVVVTTAMAITVYLARLGVSWEIFQPVGIGLVAATPAGMALDLETGLYRAAEVAAWHTAMGICFLFLLLFRKRRAWVSLVPIAGLLALFAGALLMTGRRKGIVEVALFVLVYLACLAYFRRGAVKTALLLGFLAVGGLAVFIVSTIGQELSIIPYVERGVNIGSTDVRRVQEFSVDALGTVIRHNGWFGSGAGTGSQGAQYFGGGDLLVGTAAEGGVGKIVAEVGVPGLFLMLWLGLAFARVFWRAARASSGGSRVRAQFAYGCLAFLFSNALTFTISHQIFGDPLVLIVIGVVAGFLLRMPDLEGSRRVAGPPRSWRLRGRRFTPSRSHEAQVRRPSTGSSTRSVAIGPWRQGRS